MTLGPYSSCPCGSGKPFKWCCSPLYAGINKAFEQEAQGQHDTALRLMEEVVAGNPGNPEAWGQKARLLYHHGKVEQAEEALQKAFAINANYPYGLLLRSMFRYHEGELAGALLLARRAAEAYAVDALEPLAEVFWVIFDCELKMHRPVAAREALRRLVLHYNVGDAELQQTFEAVFGDQGRLPACARREYKLINPPRELAGPAPRLGELVRTFDQTTQEKPNDPAGWHNLGLARAWLGDNLGAVDALNRALDLDPDAGRSAERAALMEVLRCGQGMEESCDYHEYSFTYPFKDGTRVLTLLQEWKAAGRLVIPPNQEGPLFGMILELSSAGVITVGAPASDQARLAGYLMLMEGMIRLYSPSKPALERLRDEFRTRLALGLNETQQRREPIQFHDVVTEALIFPTSGSLTAEQAVAHFRRHYEEIWPHQPRRSLSGHTPQDAAAIPLQRKKLIGVIQFIQDCAFNTLVARYDFDSLRRKLGLLGPLASASGLSGPVAGAPGLSGPVAGAPGLSGPVGAGPATVPHKPGAPATGPSADIASLDAAGLSALAIEGLSDEQLEQAYQKAQKLEVPDQAVAFARALVTRPANAAKPDRFPWYSFLLQQALRAGNTDAALDYVNEGEKADCEHNEGKRRNEYELRRGQVHAKRGEADQAQEVFQRLIERVPTEMRFRGAAAEAMINLKQGARALRFAEDGLTQARKQNDRDNERYLSELAGVARKQIG